MGYKLNAAVETEGVPLEFIKDLLRWYEIPWFIESGSAGGASARAVAPHFQKVHTIEIIPDRWDGPPVKNIAQNYGDSPKIIPDILKEIPEDDWVLWWLDAHYSDPFPSADEVVECPVIAELNAISAHRKSIILIDDARLFLGKPPYPLNVDKWPRIDDIFAECKKLFTFHWTTILDDYILCYPHEFRNVIEWEWDFRFHLRYPNEEEAMKKKVRDVVQAVENYLK